MNLRSIDHCSDSAQLAMQDMQQRRRRAAVAYRQASEAERRAQADAWLAQDVPLVIVGQGDSARAIDDSDVDLTWFWLGVMAISLTVWGLAVYVAIHLIRAAVM